MCSILAKIVLVLAVLLVVATAVYMLVTDNEMTLQAKLFTGALLCFALYPTLRHLELFLDDD